jgi:hypothetical protein
MPAEISPLHPAIAKHLASGAPVAVRSSFEGKWCSGYEIADIIRDGGRVAGYRLRRSSERTVLPAVFPVSDVIPAGRSSSPIAGIRRA